MAFYNVVSLSVGNHTHTFYGQQDDHNHTKNGDFVRTAISLMAQQYNCSENQVTGSGSLRIRQPQPNDGNELKWNKSGRRWDQVR